VNKAETLRVSDNADGGKTVAIDPAVITATEARKLSEKIVKNGGQPLKSVAENLVDLAWAEKPGRPNEKIKVLDIKYAGKKFEDKLEDLRKELDKKKSEGIVLSMLDEIAWLFNLRGSDIDYNPVFFSYAIVTPKDATLYVDESKLTPEVTAHLGSTVTIKPYAAIFSDMPALQAHLQTVNAGGKGPRRRYTLGSKSSWALSVGLGGEDSAEEVRSPVGDAKAIKNESEMAGMRACHVRDGAALIEFFAWLEDELLQGHEVNEIQAADKLEHIRSCVSLPSFGSRR
jgi:Xaa-Pro aminopeptidase